MASDERGQGRRRSADSAATTLRSDSPYYKGMMERSKSTDSSGSTGSSAALPPRPPRFPALQRVRHGLSRSRPLPPHQKLTREQETKELKHWLLFRTFNPYHVSKSYKAKRRYKCEVCPSLAKTKLKVSHQNKEEPMRSLEVHRFFSRHHLVLHSFSCRCDDKGHLLKHHSVMGGIRAMHKHLARVHGVRASWEGWLSLMEGETRKVTEARKQTLTKGTAWFENTDAVEQGWQAGTIGFLKAQYERAEGEIGQARQGRPAPSKDRGQTARGTNP